MFNDFDKIKDTIRLNCTFEEFAIMKDGMERRLNLFGMISSLDNDDDGYSYASKVGRIVESIMNYNREDGAKPREERRPIRLYINSPGGDITEGFALVDAIELSKTPVYTINLGEWSSMSFLIGITGHKRFSLRSATFLLHDGSSGAWGSSSKVQDRVKFEERFEKEITKKHVLKHSKMSEEVYDALVRVEYYMLAEDALKHGFIDEIITDLDTIL